MFVGTIRRWSFDNKESNSPLESNALPTELRSFLFLSFIFDKWLLYTKVWYKNQDIFNICFIEKTLNDVREFIALNLKYYCISTPPSIERSVTNPEVMMALRRPGRRSIVTAWGCPSISMIRNGTPLFAASVVASSIERPI